MIVTFVPFKSISPYREIRQEVRERIGDFAEVYVNAPLAECEKRDVKGLYAKAISGEIPNFTGISSAYEPPERADIHLDAGERAAEDLADEILAQLKLD